MLATLEKDACMSPTCPDSAFIQDKGQGTERPSPARSSMLSAAKGGSQTLETLLFNPGISEYLKVKVN